MLPLCQNLAMGTPLSSLVLVLLAALQQPSAPRGVAEVFQPGAEACWTIEQGGQRLGECATRYEGEVSLGSLRAHLFHDQVRLELATPGGKLQQLFTVALWTDSAGHPLRLDFRAQMGDAKSAVEGAFTGGKAELVVRQGPSEKPLSVKLPDEVYLLTNNFVSQLELALLLAPEGPLTLFSANALKTFPYTLKRVEAPDGALVYEDSLGERLTLSTEHRLVLLELPPQKLTMRRVEEKVERFTIELAQSAPAADIEREEVEIVDGDVSLAGTLTRKKGLVAQGGKLPAVFFLSGSGPQDREGFSSGIDVGTHEILDRLTREGFLVLRVDDRGVGASTGPTQDMDFDDLVEDGRRAVRFLLARPDVDPRRVVLIGHSEGGVSAPILATTEPIAAVVLMAAPGRPIDELLGEQLRFGRALQGAKPEELAAFERELDAFLDHIAKGEPIPNQDLAPELAAFVPARAWLLSHLGRDPLAVLKQVRCPILILQGGKDVQVSAERDAPRLVAALDAAKHADHELKLFPALDHLFKKASDPPSELDYLKARPVDAEFLDALAAWLRARLMK
jgi:pimeloyl-ACP methyl ester carboxylesterase